jgi:uncharacterized membrane protein YGL010W
MALFSDKSMDQWVQEYALAHQHPINRVCHSIGIPLIVASLILYVGCLIIAKLWLVATSMFILGWLLQFIGHAFEGKPPEFFKDWRFLFVGLRWWISKHLKRRKN